MTKGLEKIKFLENFEKESPTKGVKALGNIDLDCKITIISFLVKDINGLEAK